jgi:hypothetical protein
MPFPTITTPSEHNLGRQNPLYQNFLTAYTSTGVPTSTPYVITGGFNGTIMWEIVENNVAGGATIDLQGSFDGTNWYDCGFYIIVTAGTTNTTLSRTKGATAVAQNSRYVWQQLDAYPYTRANVAANASNASLTVNVYAVAG